MFGRKNQEMELLELKLRISRKDEKIKMLLKDMEDMGRQIETQKELMLDMCRLCESQIRKVERKFEALEDHLGLSFKWEPEKLVVRKRGESEGE